MELPPGVESVLAPNPSLMTGPGTSTYLISGTHGPSLVIDPGPLIEEHLQTVVRRAPFTIEALLITHGHPDHMEGAARLRELSGAPILAWSREGVPAADQLLADGEVIPLGNRSLLALHTPGHRFDHLSFMLQESRAVFAGDLVAGSGTVVIAPPEGNLAQYMTSLQRLLDLDPQVILPAHGPLIADPRALLLQYIAHRQEREEQVLAGLASAPATVETLVKSIYADVDPQLHPMAALSLTSHLYKLEGEGRVTRTGEIWSLARG